MKAKIVNTMSAVWAALICVMIGGLTACQDYSIDSQPEGAPQILCDAVEQYNVASTDVDNILFNVSANTPWKITVSTEDEDQSWCVPSPGMSSAAGLVSEIAVTIADNEKETPREATLTIMGEKIDKKIVVKVIQESKSALKITGAAVTEVFEVAGGTKDMIIRANRAWEITYKNEQDRNWLHFNLATAEVNGVETITVTVTADANESVKREAVVVVKTEFDEEEVTIMQKGATLEVSEDKLEELKALSAVPEATEIIEVPVSATINWKIEEGTDEWIKNLTKVGNDKLTFSYDTNYNFAPRTAIIMLKAERGNMTYSIQVTQLGAAFYCYGKSDTNEGNLPKGRITDKGLLLQANDNFRIAFPGDYKHAKLTWEFEEISISSPLVLMGANKYDAGKTPNTHIVLCNVGAAAINSGNDWRVNGLGNFFVFKDKENILKNNSSSIKTVELSFVADSKAVLSVKDKDGNVLLTKTSDHSITDAAWGTNTFSYSLYFQAGGDSSQYCILKSFKAESLD